MALAIVHTRALSGLSAPAVTVEVHLSNGMAGLHMVGMAETAVKESKDRVRSAIINSHFEFPCKYVTINLAPADLPKEGSRFDLPIALGILAASQQIPGSILNQYEFAGELALSGELRGVRGILPMVLNTQQSGRKLIVPQENAAEAGLVAQDHVLSAQHILEVCAYLKDERKLPRCLHNTSLIKNQSTVDLADVKGQPQAKRALEIAASGNHSLLFIGPPGTGKTMLASRLTSILPEMNEQQALEAAAIASLSSNGFTPQQWRQIPFRSPHHTSSSIALVGGGRPPRPGEISLAHHGVLFLDELPEFSRHVLECLREPLESGCVTISRAAFQSIYPAQFQLIAAMNPCPCGYAGSPCGRCECTQDQIKRYRSKISGPLLDRIDMHVEVARIPQAMIMQNNHNNSQEETSVIVRERVIKAQAYQQDRQGKCNAALLNKELNQYCLIKPSAQQLLNHVMTKLNLSARAYHRIIKVARSIADLERDEMISEHHVSEALSYRCLDRT